MDGWQVLEQLRSDGRLARINVVIITSAAHRAPAGVPVFEKPLDLDKVLHALDGFC
jgi:CheY-like chemotaxis protein